MQYSLRKPVKTRILTSTCVLVSFLSPSLAFCGAVKTFKVCQKGLTEADDLTICSTATVEKETDSAIHKGEIFDNSSPPVSQGSFGTVARANNVSGNPRCLKFTVPPANVTVGQDDCVNVTVEFKAKKAGEIKESETTFTLGGNDVDENLSVLHAGDISDFDTGTQTGTLTLGNNGASPFIFVSNLEIWLRVFIDRQNPEAIFGEFQEVQACA